MMYLCREPASLRRKRVPTFNENNMQRKQQTAAIADVKRGEKPASAAPSPEESESSAIAMPSIKASEVSTVPSLLASAASGVRDTCTAICRSGILKEKMTGAFFFLLRVSLLTEQMRQIPIIAKTDEDMTATMPTGIISPNILPNDMDASSTAPDMTETTAMDDVGREMPEMPYDMPTMTLSRLMARQKSSSIKKSNVVPPTINRPNPSPSKSLIINILFLRGMGVPPQDILLNCGL